MRRPTLPPLPTVTVEPLAVGIQQLAAMLSLSRRTIERERSAGRFPPPDKIIGNRPLWLISTIRRWIGGDA